MSHIESPSQPEPQQSQDHQQDQEPGVEEAVAPGIVNFQGKIPSSPAKRSTSPALLNFSEYSKHLPSQLSSTPCKVKEKSRSSSLEPESHSDSKPGSDSDTKPDESIEQITEFLIKEQILTQEDESWNTKEVQEFEQMAQALIDSLENGDTLENNPELDMLNLHSVYLSILNKYLETMVETEQELETLQRVSRTTQH